jgi:L-asparaginase II
LRAGIAERVVVCNSDGRMVFTLCDNDAAVFPRSAIKAFQALPLIESGAADRYGLEQPLHNWNGAEVEAIRPGAALTRQS